tara:strand:+ start:45 stop:176 length:132 start_codon:yes stop_codon:yes gene_type:complete
VRIDVGNNLVKFEVTGNSIVPATSKNIANIKKIYVFIIKFFYK